MKKIIIILLVAVLLTASAAQAFDGQRKGFVLGGGFGFAPLIKTEASAGTNPMFDYKKSGTAGNLMFGYGWDDNNMLVFETNIAMFSQSGLTFTQGISAITWYDYDGFLGKGTFFALGVGITNYSVTLENDADQGASTTGKIGILVGLGYEFTKHWQAGLYIFNGKSEDGPYKFKHGTISIVIGGVAF